FVPGWLVYVNREGRRFIKETAEYAVMSGAVKAQTGGSCFALFDDVARAEARPDPRFADAFASGTLSLNWVTETLDEQVRSGRVIQADSLDDLALRCGIRPGSLNATVERYNADCAAGSDSMFFKDAAQMKPIRQPPFHAVEIRPAIVCLTSTGLRIHRSATVLDGRDQPIAGLFAAGPDEFPAAAAALLEEIDGMIFKEESILFPTALEKLKAADWAEIFRESAQTGYIFIDPPAAMAEALDIAANTGVAGGAVNLPSGNIRLEQLVSLLDTLPVDLTLVDAEDTVRYFSEGKDRVFLRARSILGRKVQNCHPPASLAAVEKIVNAFRAGTRDSEEFWINMKGRVIHIRYFALRGPAGEYLGALEVTQDITDIQKIKGERRLA
ncbi:MAG: PAS domain-containing protein, partial [Elusimicrobiales bacterium]|nr:PAS domain-containing protein [Elusimicrobiales bacterium]